MKWPLRNNKPTIPAWGQVGDFAFRRSFYHHPGIDLYCPDHTIVQAMEEGTVVHIEDFTGPQANPPSPWWMPTRSLLIEGTSGVLGYCEMEPYIHLKVGSYIFEGESLGLIVPVLKKDKGNGTTMAHIEKYLPGTKEHVTWVLDTPKPTNLRNPRKLLESIINENLRNSSRTD